MIYRVVKQVDGMYRCQFRVLFFLWDNSSHPPSGDLNDQLRFASINSSGHKYPYIKEVVWP